MKLSKSTEAVLTHVDRYTLTMTFQELYDLRSMLYMMRNGNAIAANEFYSDVVNAIIKATEQ